METISALIDSTGMSLADFAKTYEIPYRTVQEWHAGRRVPPPYVVSLLRFALQRQAAEGSSHAG